MSEAEIEKDPERDFVSKLVATIVFGSLVASVMMAMSIIGNHLVNGEDMVFVVVGFMTHVANLVIAVLFAYSLYKVWRND